MANVSGLYKVRRKHGR